MRTTFAAALAGLALSLAALPVIAQSTQGGGGTPRPGAAPARGDDAGTATRSAVAAQDGAGVYRAICQACHMANGQGGTGAATIPALAKNPRLAAAAYPILLVVKGRGAMPGFRDTLTSAQIAAVVGYVRTQFGNAYPGAVTAEDVARYPSGAPAKP